MGSSVCQVRILLLASRQCLIFFITSDEIFLQLASSVSSLQVPKSTLGWDLEELEALLDDDASRESDSDDESEGEVERMLPAQI